MSLARIAPDAEHDLRLPQLALESRAPPPEARVDARVDALLRIPEENEIDLLATQPAVSEITIAAIDDGAAVDVDEDTNVTGTNGQAGPGQEKTVVEAEDFLRSHQCMYIYTCIHIYAAINSYSLRLFTSVTSVADINSYPDMNIGYDGYAARKASWNRAGVEPVH